MELNIGILIAQTVNFVLILVVFKFLVGDKLSKAIVARRVELAKAADATTMYEEMIAKAEVDKKTLIDEGIEHKNKLIDEAKQSAQQKADAIVATAEKDASAITKKAEEKAAKLENDLKNDFVDGVKQTAHVVVKKLFEKDVTLEEKYLDELVGEFVK